MNLFDRISDLRVLVVGDPIIDEYNYVTPIGKSIKEPVISTLYKSKEEFRGGVWAAAEHIKTLCKHVQVMPQGAVMVNRRFVDRTYTHTHKLFTVHERRDGNSWPSWDAKDYDLAIVTDFGHGAMTPELIERLTRSARFLAVNTQTNSQNYGFNLIHKYPRADFVVLDELEARLAAHDKESPIEDVILRIVRDLGYQNVIVTLGANGAVGFDGAFHRQKALTSNIVDTIGAGDAFLAVTSPFAAAGIPMTDLVRIGNAAGAIKVGIVGHQKSVTKEALLKALSYET